MNVIFLILLFLFIPIVNAFEIDDSIKYSWNLSSESVIKIVWNGFNDSCNVKIYWRNINLLSKSYDAITFDYWQLSRQNWQISLICDEKNSSFVYEFPYIKEIEVDSEDRRLIYINWSWFNNSSNVIVNGASFEYISKNDTNITIKLNEKSYPESLYVDTDSLKSNLVELEPEYPEIDFAKAKEWFSYNKEAIVCWKRFSNDDIIVLWQYEIKYPDFKLKNGCFEFRIPYSFDFKPELYIKNDFFESKPLKLEYTVDTPYIETINKWSFYNSSRRVDYDAFVITWKNFSNYTSSIEVYVNGRKVETFDADRKHIYAKYDNIYPWSNFIYVVINWKWSNYVNYKNNVGSVRITDIKYWWEYKEWHKFTVYFWWKFDEDNYVFNINNYNAQNVTCSKYHCIVYFRGSSYKSWTVFVSYRWKKLTNDFYFGDKELDNEVYVSHVEFPDGVWYNKTVIIHWDNFNWINYVSANNLFSKDRKSKDEYKVNWSWTKILWVTPSNYNIDQSSSFALRTPYSSISMSFSKAQINWNNVYFAPAINRIEGNKLGFKPWDEVTIVWKGFNKDNILLIWDTELNLEDVKLLSENKVVFEIPDDIVSWMLNIKFKNPSNFYSNSEKIYVLSEGEKRVIQFFKDSTFKPSIFFAGETKWESIAQYKVINHIWDASLNKLKINLTPIDSSYGTFMLYVNWRKHSEEIASPAWDLTFKDVLIPFSESEIIIDLRKDSPFFNKWLKQINLDLSNTNYYLLNQNIRVDNLAAISSNTIQKIRVANAKVKTCFAFNFEEHCNNITLKQEEPVSITSIQPENKIEKEDIEEKNTKSEKYRDKIRDIMPKIDAYVVNKSNWDASKQKKTYKLYYEYFKSMEGNIKTERKKIYLNELLVQLKNRM